MITIKPIIAKFSSKKQPLINYVGKGDDRLRALLIYCKKPLEQLAENQNLKLTIAQRDDLLLINSGAKTAAFNLSEVATPSEIVEKVYKNASCNIT